MPFQKQIVINQYLDTFPGNTAQQTYNRLFPEHKDHVFMVEPLTRLCWEFSCGCGGANTLSMGHWISDTNAELDANFRFMLTSQKNWVPVGFGLAEGEKP